MPNHALQSVQISTIAHATDDFAKVQQALRFLLPETLKDKQVFTRAHLHGHHGNPIVTFEARLTKSQDVKQFSTHFSKQLPRNEKVLIERELDRHTDDEGNLYLRLNKQQAFRGILELTDEDPVRVKLKFSRLSGESRSRIREFLEVE